MTRNELYGSLHPTTREWREGLVSVTFRDMSNNKTNKHQWIVLDGDIDAEWIEVCAIFLLLLSKPIFVCEGILLHNISLETCLLI